MNMELSDEHLVEHALAGETKAFDEIMRRWQRRIHALCTGILASPEDARDATQETFLAAFRNLKGFRGEAKVSSWLHRIAINQCISRGRRARVRPETSLDEETDLNGAGSVVASARESPARQVESSDRREAVRRAVGALPPELRHIVIMKEFEELTFQEIADILDLPLSTVKSRLYTALK
ncbi:MAG: sigma-70 family RNA polymerase sigma factor, partial [Pyrinomonadaceae bacterium]|nr:sigma-70 family RNA polymerase sigma factor [Pyrinomonadaceae bacterium]